MTERKRPDDPADWTAADWRAQAEAVNRAAARLVAKGWPHNYDRKEGGDVTGEDASPETLHGSGAGQGPSREEDADGDERQPPP